MMSSARKSLQDLITKKKKKRPNPEGEKPPCSSKDKDQPQRDEVSKGTDRGTSEDEEKTKGDAKKDEAAGPLEQTLQSLHQMQHYAGTENNNTTLTEKLKTIASDKGFRISDNQGSGNCMFHALSEQLETIKGIKIQHGQLRQSLVQYLRKNSRLPDGTDLCHFVDGHETWSNYLTYMEQDGTWGDHVILCAAANHFKTCIHVVSSLNNDVVIRPHDLVDESKPLVLGHIDNVHYVSLQPIKEETPCSSKDKKQPKINVVLTGPDQDTSEKGGKTKEDKKEDQAAEGKTKGGKEKGQAAEKPPCSSKDKDQPQRDEVSKGTDSGTVLCGSTEEELKSEKEVCAATCTAVEGDTSVSENNKELNQLHSVKKEGDVTEMKSTLPRGFSVDSRNTTGRTPLMNAALNGNVQTVKSMIELGADPSLTDNEGWNTLHHAACGGDTDVISLIHTHLLNIESKTGDGCTPLMLAASTSKLHAVKWFLEKGATVACEDKIGGNTLHHAAEGGDTEIISLIHTRLPNIESKTGEGLTPLMEAAYAGNLLAVKWFLDKGATVAYENKRGWNALHFAAESGNTEILSLIHTHLPNIESKTGEGYTPLMVAAGNGNLHAVKWFLEKGATIACEDKRGWSPLHHAAKGGDPDTIDLILTHLPDVDSRTADGETPLIIAVFYDNPKGIKYLLERGANPLAKDTEGQDSLYHASSCDSDCFDLLLNHVPRSESTTGND